MKIFKEIYDYREMIYNLVHRELRGKYKGSALGFAWTFINPLLQLGVYTIVFSYILVSGIEDYYLFLFVTLIPWIFFSSSIAAGASCIRSQGNMVKKIYFPREVIPISFVTSQFVSMLLSFLVVFTVLLISGKGFNFSALVYLPLIMLIEYFIAIGLNMIISGLAVYFRDIEHLIGVIVLLWQFLTPVMYDVSRVPERLQPIYKLNPMTPIIVAYRDILYYKRTPELDTLISAVLFGFFIVIIGFLIFSKLKKHFAEEL